MTDDILAHVLRAEREEAVAEREEARNLARLMFNVLQQMPFLPGDLMEDWPDDPPRWLIDR